ncbi:IS30 family transposase [Georgenia thermotolerans]|uniref:IS30 family transposase n=1 Tax=Georgenia thermotolerans TaxID=527326 RepID=A0A7J5UIA7_9MICO|nr:IS30 family transposase [Georgenia thermotolerans]
MRGLAVDLLAEGHPVPVVAERVGCGARQVYRWAILAGMRFSVGCNGGLIPAVGLPGGGSGHGRRLTLADRTQIQIGVEAGLSQARIAELVGCHQSTISRELRNGSLQYRSRRRYNAQAGEHRAAAARSRPKTPLLERNALLRAAVVSGLNSRYSPEQVANRLRVDFPHCKEMRVSHETIYQALYLQGRGSLRQELKVVKALRSGRTSRIPQSRLPRASSRPWLEGARLSDRPAEAGDRAVPGHWEGDLVVGPENSGIITLVERTTRFCLLRRLPGARDSQTVIDRLSEMIGALPAELRRTLTWDQGTEMARHATFTVRTDCPVYFCDPHSPWQRGSNENLNGLIRDFFPKGTNFNEISDAEIQHAQDLLNTRPRETLNWATPLEKLTAFIQADALTA